MLNVQHPTRAVQARPCRLRLGRDRSAFRTCRGFTLIELVLVLMLIAITLSMVAPSFRGWSKSGKLRDAADQFQAVTRKAQSQSAAEAVTYAITIASDGHSYQLAPARALPDTDTTDVEKFDLPEHLTIELVKAADADNASIRFFPTGSTTPAQVRITADWGESVDLACTSPIAVFTQVKDQ